MKSTIIVAVCILLGGCSIFSTMHDRRAYIASKDAYTKCLTENPSEISPCQGLRRAYEVNQRVYEAD